MGPGVQEARLALLLLVIKRCINEVPPWIVALITSFDFLLFGDAIHLTLVSLQAESATCVHVLTNASACLYVSLRLTICLMFGSCVCTNLWLRNGVNVCSYAGISDVKIQLQYDLQVL